MRLYALRGKKKEEIGGRGSNEKPLKKRYSTKKEDGDASCVKERTKQQNKETVQ